MQPVYTPDQAAAKLQLTPATVRQYLRQGIIKGVHAGRLWRITESALKEFMEKGTPYEGLITYGDTTKSFTHIGVKPEGEPPGKR